MSWGRLVPAGLLAPLVLWGASFEPVPVYLVGLGLCALLASGEVYLLLWRAGHRPAWPIGMALAVLLAAGMASEGGHLSSYVLGPATFAALVWAALRHPLPNALLDWALTLAPALYVGALLHYYLLLRTLPDGAFWVQLVLLCTWAADITAYFVGRRWGRTKLAPALSPMKSVEGALAGLAAAILVAGAAALVEPRRLPLLALVGLGAVVGAAGLVGDLAESFLKRQLGAKDASRLLRGHGGLLDRIDSLLAAGMVAYYYLVVGGR